MFDKRFKSERKRLGLTQQQIANKLGISRSNVANWENGGNEASNEMLLKCSELFGCSTDYLLGKSDYRNPEDYVIDFNKLNLTSIKNDIKVLKAFNKNINDELNLNNFYSLSEEQINKGIEVPRSNSEILLDKLKELDLLKTNADITEKELNVILEFVSNNKTMLKHLMENK